MMEQIIIFICEEGITVGELRVGNNTNGNQSLDILYPDWYSVTNLELGGVFTSVMINGHLYMWGYNDEGELGLGNTNIEESYNTPQVVPHINALEFNQIEETTITDTSFEFSFYFYDSYTIDISTNVVVELEDENGTSAEYNANFVSEDLVNESYQFKITNLDSESTYNFKSIEINDRYLDDNINQPVRLYHFNFIEIDQASITDTSFQFTMEIDVNEYIGVIDDPKSNLEVELITNGTSTFNSANLINIVGNQYTYEVTGLEQATTYDLISVNYNQYFEPVNEIFTTNESIIQDEFLSILYISLIVILIIILLMIILLLVKYLTGKNLESFKTKRT